eukprot:7466853-Pyramimonas_sp.AAC.1
MGPYGHRAIGLYGYRARKAILLLGYRAIGYRAIGPWGYRAPRHPGICGRASEIGYSQGTRAGRRNRRPTGHPGTRAGRGNR